MNIKEECKKYIKKWENCGYNEIPDEIPLRINQLKLAPSYKELALKILNNDFKSNKKSRVYFELKKIELIKLGKITKSRQLKIKL